MAVSQSVKVRRDGTLVLESGGGSPVQLTITYEDGNFSANSLAQNSNQDQIVIRDRGSIVGLRKGDDQVGTLGFSVHYREFTNAGSGVLLDFINGTSAGSTLNTAGGAGFEQFLCKITFTTEGTDNGDNADGQAIFNSVLLTADFSEGDPDVLNVQGSVFGAITYTGQS